VKRFKYRLEALLKVKDHIEKERQKKLADSMKQVRDQVTELERIDADRAGTVEHQQKRMLSRFSVAEMLVVSRYFFKLRKDTLVGRELLKVLTKDEATKRQELLEATKERKKYQKLKEVQQEKHYAEIEAVLTKETDENAINFYRQKQGAVKAADREKNSRKGK
jgi:flagellar FliJ protein